MCAHRIVVVESEKSPKVCSTNWKEDVVLKRNLQVLDRSQRTVINRIIVDQKILNKRFQTKRSRSKMAWARATGNAEMQKRLREKTTFVLNTNVGHKEDDDDDMLRGIWEKGRRLYTRRLDADEYRRKKEIGAFTCIEDDVGTASTPRKKENPPVQQIKGGNMRADIMVTIDKYYLQKPTPAPHNQTTKRSNHHRKGSMPIIVDPPDDDEGPVGRPQTAFVTTTDDTKAIHRKGRPSTANGFLRTINDMIGPSPTPTPRAGSSRPIATKPMTNNAGIGSMFDSDEFQISLLDFQRFRVDSANYESRVQKYGQTIKTLKMDKSRATDYYTAKLAAESGDCKRTFKMEAARDATEEDIKRATGDLSIRSLTLKPVITL